MLGVASLVTIDLVILVTFTLVEGIKGNLAAKLVSHREMPTKTEGVSTNFSRFFHSLAALKTLSLFNVVFLHYRCLKL